ncbi:unnamed protein product, partial [Prorocentrum cordatum]
VEETKAGLVVSGGQRTAATRTLREWADKDPAFTWNDDTAKTTVALKALGAASIRRELLDQVKTDYKRTATIGKEYTCCYKCLVPSIPDAAKPYLCEVKDLGGWPTGMSAESAWIFRPGCPKGGVLIDCFFVKAEMVAARRVPTGPASSGPRLADGSGGGGPAAAAGSGAAPATRELWRQDSAPERESAFREIAQSIGVFAEKRAFASPGAGAGSPRTMLFWPLRFLSYVKGEAVPHGETRDSVLATYDKKPMNCIIRTLRDHVPDFATLMRFKPFLQELSTIGALSATGKALLSLAQANLSSPQDEVGAELSIESAPKFSFSAAHKALERAQFEKQCEEAKARGAGSLAERLSDAKVLLGKARELPDGRGEKCVKELEFAVALFGRMPAGEKAKHILGNEAGWQRFDDWQMKEFLPDVSDCQPLLQSPPDFQAMTVGACAAAADAALKRAPLVDDVPDAATRSMLALTKQLRDASEAAPRVGEVVEAVVFAVAVAKFHLNAAAAE